MQTNIHVGRLLKTFNVQMVGEKKDIKMVRLGLAVKRYLSQKSQTDFIYYVAFGKTSHMNICLHNSFLLLIPYSSNNIRIIG